MKLWWTNRWAQPYESLFNWLLKLAWANVPTPDAFARELIGRSMPADNVARPLDLVYAEWHQSKSHEWRSGIPFEAGLLHERRPGGGLALARQAGPYRFCRSCLLDGYHSKFFQIAALKKCPLHHEDLLAHCRQCGANSVSVSFSRKAFENPFRCHRCGYPLAGAVDPCRWVRPSEYHDELLRAFEPMEKWLERVTRASAGLCYFPEFNVFDEFSEPAEVSRFFAANKFIPLDIDGELLFPSRLPLSASYVTTGGSEDSIRVYTFGRICGEDRYSVFGSVSKYILKLLLNGHESCVEAARRNLERLGQNSDHRLYFEPYGCPLAQAYVRWEHMYLYLIKYELKWGPPLFKQFERSASRAAVEVDVFSEFMSAAASELERYALLKLPRDDRRRLSYGAELYSFSRFLDGCAAYFRLEDAAPEVTKYMAICPSNDILDRLGEACEGGTLAARCALQYGLRLKQAIDLL